MNKLELETKSNVIDAVLTQHGIKARVTGGVVAPRSVQFTLATIAPARKVKSLAGAMAAAIGEPEVQVARQGGHIVLMVKRTDAQPVKLLTLLARTNMQKLPACTATLGLCDDGAPLLVRLPSQTVGNVLVTGDGALSLLRTMAVSLAVTNRPQNLRLAFVGNGLGDLTKFRHFSNFTAADLVRLLGREDANPRIVLVVNFLTVGLGQLLTKGRAAGIHVIASSPGLGDSAGFKTLITSKCDPGDFEVMDAGQPVRFTAATITPAEVNQIVIGAMPKREPTRLQLASAMV